MPPKDDPSEIQAGEAISLTKILSGDYTDVIKDMPELAACLEILKTSPPDAPNINIDPLLAPPATPEPPSRAALRARRAREDSDLAKHHPHLAKQLEAHHERYDNRRHGPQGEFRSRSMADWIHPIPIEKITAETDFRNIRIMPTDGEIDLLADSMSEEGLKVPITVSEGQGEIYFLRAGFRRVAAARKLGWTTIPAIVLPLITPKISEHWTNIIENSARTSLRTYEIANAAYIMKRDFCVDPKIFARKAGYDPTYITRLVRAIENLPPTILDHWRDVGNHPVDWYCKWSTMRHEEAIKSFRLEVGQRFHIRKDPMLPADHPRPTRRGRVMTATNSGLKRMQRLRFAVLAYTKPMDETSRQSYLEIIDYCMGIRDTVLDIYDCNARHKNARGRKSKEEEVEELNIEEEMQKMIEEVCTGEEDGKPVVSDVLPIRLSPTARPPRK
jgi:ParB/RepB/Spo0J family partition protein